MINSTKWWPVGSRPSPPEGVVHSFAAVLHSGADLLEHMRPDKKPGKVMQVTRINNDHAPANAKFVDTCKQVSKHQFPQDYWEQKARTLDKSSHETA
eukprot:7700394-Karenia_brevis.AAC.1